jgi:hypothetical protein
MLPSAVDADKIIKAVAKELQSHKWDTYVEGGIPIAQGGKGVVVPGCPRCEKRIHTMGGFMDYLTEDVLSGAIEAALYGREPGEEG